MLGRRAQRDLTRATPLDGAGGAIGIETIEMREKIDSVKHDLVDWKVRSALELGQSSLSLSRLDMHVLPECVTSFTAVQELDLSYNFLVGGALAAALAVASAADTCGCVVVTKGC
jgi:hypothetical protein